MIGINKLNQHSEDVRCELWVMVVPNLNRRVVYSETYACLRLYFVCELDVAWCTLRPLLEVMVPLYESKAIVGKFQCSCSIVWMSPCYRGTIYSFLRHGLIADGS